MWGIDMANVYLDDTTLTAIADAIRAKTGGTSPITPANMDEEIASIVTGGGAEDYSQIIYKGSPGIVTTGNMSAIHPWNGNSAYEQTKINNTYYNRYYLGSGQKNGVTMNLHDCFPSDPDRILAVVGIKNSIAAPYWVYARNCMGYIIKNVTGYYPWGITSYPSNSIPSNSYVIVPLSFSYNASSYSLVASPNNAQQSWTWNSGLLYIPNDTSMYKVQPYDSNGSWTMWKGEDNSSNGGGFMNNDSSAKGYSIYVIVESEES